MTIDELKKKRVGAVSLGCDKNRVDLEKMLFNLKSFGFNVYEKLEDCEIVIVNTCAFIQPATTEAINAILDMQELKQQNCEKLIVTGCLYARYGVELQQSFPEVDAFVDIKDNKSIVNIILGLYDLKGNVDYINGRVLTNFSHFAYLKIADGCDNGCAYCTIPRIRGRYRSEPYEMLIKEAKDLADQGVKELILVAQDITRYGTDLYNKNRLVELIKDLSKIKNLKWIRLHYCYPETITEELLQEVANNPKVCKYLDIPLQHIDDKILKDMNRRSNEEQVRSLITNIKTNYPEIVIRSTFIIGFPGETRRQFNKLLQFLQDVKLNNVGFFSYSKEEKTKAYFMKKQVPNFIKKMRLNKIQKVQEKVMNALNINQLGQEVEVLVDFYDEEINSYVGRTQYNSPEVDFLVVFEGDENTKVGEFQTIKLAEYYEGIFEGEIVK